MALVNSNLIIDVGVYDGNDTAYYLSKGFSVIGVDADPTSCERVRHRFEKELREKRLKILNLGIAEVEGECIFYRCTEDPNLSTMDASRRVATKTYEVINVQTLPLRKLVEDIGVPYYIKIDIEGLDEIAVQSLTPDLAPKYLSVELSLDPSVLHVLGNLGYHEFKLINQYYHTDSTEIADDDWSWRLLRKIGRTVPACHTMIRALPHRLRPKMEWDAPLETTQLSAKQYRSSGPFGEDTFGHWMGFEETLRRINWARSRFDYLWWDLHARLRG